MVLPAIGALALTYLIQNGQVYLRSVSETWSGIGNAPAEVKEVGRQTKRFAPALNPF